MMAVRIEARTSYAIHRFIMRAIQFAVALAVLTLAGLWVSASASAAQTIAATVAVREQVVVPSGTICLAHLAEISAPEEQVGVLGDIEIGPSPLAGHARTITAGYIRMRIARAGFGRNDVQLEGAHQVIVRCEAAAVTPVTTERINTPTAQTSVTGTQAQVDPLSVPPVAVRRGSNVKITVVSGRVSVTASGQLSEDTTVGEYTTARVRATGRQVFGRLNTPNEMVVRL